MPRISWRALPPGIKRHLRLRLSERQITENDVIALMHWTEGDPDVPEGPWWKDFGSFKLAGEGRYPKTFLTREQTVFGAVEPAIRIPADELAALVERFGSNARLMGSWNICGDGSLEIPKDVLRAAVRELGSASLDRAIEELRSGSDSLASQLLIAKVSEAYERYFLDLAARMQAETDPEKSARLQGCLVKELFGA